MLSLALAFAAGALSTLSPCVLPLIPILVATALQSGRGAPLALSGGLVISFATVGSALSMAGAAATTSESIRFVGAVALTVFGLVLLLPWLKQALSRALQPMASVFASLMSALPGRGWAGQFLVGAVLGVVWSPCTGPTLGAVAGLAASAGDFSMALTTMLVYGMGAAVPLLVVAYTGRAAGNRGLVLARRWADAGSRVLGAALLLAGLLTMTGGDRIIEAAMMARMPAWLVDLVTRY